MSTISWLTQEDFLRDLNNYAEYTRPKIDEHGEVVCDTPVPDTLRRFFEDKNNDEISSKEKLKTKEMDSDKDVDESSFEKRDEPKADSTKKAMVVVPKYHKQQQEAQDDEFVEPRGFVPQRIAYWHAGAYGSSNSQSVRTATANVRMPKQPSHRNQRGRGRGGAKYQNRTVFIPAGMALSYSHF